MVRGPIDHAELSVLAERLGAPVQDVEPVGWGDAHATHRLSLADGRRFAARRLAGPAEHSRAQRIGDVMTGLARAGLPVPTPTILEAFGGPWLITAWVEGEVGASWLGDPERARHLADRMGRLVARLRAVDPADLGLHGAPTAGGSPGDSPAPAAFVHGDFAPVNVVMDASGEIAALLDFERAGTGPALLDVAWWGWVVRHHHPEAWSVAWPTFLSAADLLPAHDDATLRELVLRTLDDRAATAGDAETRRRWLDRLAEARSWPVPGDQAT